MHINDIHISGGVGVCKEQTFSLLHVIILTQHLVYYVG